MSELNIRACPICYSKDRLVRQSIDLPDHSLVWYECGECASLLLWVDSDRWTFQKVEREDKTHLLGQVLSESQLHALINLVDGEASAVIPKPDERGIPTWGVRVNAMWPHAPDDYPQWASQIDRKKWQEPGLIVWDSDAQLVTHLTATQSLQLLDHLRSDKAWQQDGITVGEPTTKLYLGDPHREPEHVLVNQILLSFSRAHQLFDFLVRYEAELEQMSDAEEKERRRRLRRVYSMLLDLANQAEDKAIDQDSEG